ncbi:GlcG/HbpS family heme-binding protein [Sphingobium algorifonticola]|nr:heme-binding protein [Sphingobium algorifonticola]
MTVTLNAATAVIAKAIDAATAQNVPIVAVVTDVAGHIVSMSRMDGVGHVNIEVARKKALASATFGQPTHEVVDAVSRDPLAKIVVLGDQSINLLPGGIPLKDGERVIGALGIAGGYYLQDRAIAEFAAA